MSFLPPDADSGQPAASNTALLPLLARTTLVAISRSPPVVVEHPPAFTIWMGIANLGSRADSLITRQLLENREVRLAHLKVNKTMSVDV